MNRIIHEILIISIILSIKSIYLLSQTAKEIEEKKKTAYKDIENATKMLKEIEESKTLTIEGINILEIKIDAHNTIIFVINKEIDEIEKKIESNKEIIQSLEQDLKRLKQEYAKMIYYTYKNSKSYDRMIFILASKDFNQAYRRMKYLQQYTKYRKEQAEVIVKAQNVLHENLIELEAYKSKKEKLVNEKYNEQRNMNKEIYKKERKMEQISKEEKKLKKEIEEKKLITKNLEKELLKIIEEERKKTENRNVRLNTMEKIISDDFEKNKGKLPWPTERGIVTEKFGEHPHPVLNEIKIRNNGIDIATITGSDVKAIFKGKVTKIIAILGANYTVIIKHGEYYTVYNNLIDICVKQGQDVETKEKIGKVFTDKNSNKTLLHIEIWENLNKLDPELWLSN